MLLSKALGSLLQLQSAASAASTAQAAAAAACAAPRHVWRRFLGAGASAAAAAESAASGPSTGTGGPLSLVLFVPSAVCGYLAYWQYERSKWKEGLIQLRQEMLSAEPLPVYDLQDMQDYRKVSCSGRYVHERSIFVGPRPRSIPGMGIQSGYFLITPLYDPVRRGAVMVNRGWVPAAWLDDIAQVASASDAIPTPDPSAPAAAAATSTTPAAPTKRSWFGRAAKPEQQAAATEGKAAPAVHVVGVLQPNEQPSRVLPDNVPSKLEFHWIDVPALASAVGLPSDTPLVQAISDAPNTVQQTNKGANPVQQARRNSMPGLYGGRPDYPIAKNTHDLINFTTMPKDHWVYAGIWTSLCVVLAGMARTAAFTKPTTYRMVKGSPELWRAVSAGGSKPQGPA